MTSQLPNFVKGNKYVLVTIDHYFKQCEACLMKGYNAFIIANFLKEQIICKFGIAKFILTYNGSEWMKEFDVMF
jgi:hypothetical protein